MGEEFGQRLSAFTVGKPWSVICSETYGVICATPTINSSSAELRALLAYYNKPTTNKAVIDQMIVTSMNAAGQTCTGVNEGPTACGAATTTQGPDACVDGQNA